MVPYRWEIAPYNSKSVCEFQGHLGLTRPTSLVLACRGLELSEIEEFLDPTFEGLTDPLALPGTRAAAARLWLAVQRQENILIHGDYDTDGITATVLLSRVLTQNGARVESFLPHRLDDGYGLTPESIEKACREHHSLLITVDCGVTSCAAVDAARAMGIDVIVTDHHEPSHQLPSATAVIDPKLPGADPRIVELAGVGVAFKVAHAFINYGRENGLGGFATDLRDVLDLVALGTVADIVPLLQENRTLVKYGLDVLSRQHRPGIRALCEVVGLNAGIRAPDIAFRLAPRINASGRMGDPALSLKLMEAESVTVAYQLAKSLDEQNRNRQAMEADTFVQAQEQIEALCNLEEDRALVVWGEDWHQGVLGIVAARLVRQYHRPSVVLTRDVTGFLSGSGRSVAGVNLVEILEQCKDLLVRFGGHPMAAGVSMNRENINLFSKRFDRLLRKVLAAEDMCPRLQICGEVTLAEMDERFFAELPRLEPFGQGNPEPVFVTRGVNAESVYPVGRGHARGVLRDYRTSSELRFIAFGRLPESFPPSPWDVVYRPQLNSHNGCVTPQAQILDVRAAR